jgi:sulfate adenylyltransferase subunit 1
MTQQKIIKFLTAGNVDDGKSTLIGRLLHDTDSLYQDQIDEVKKSTDQSFKDDTKGDLDFSLFLDGLLSERAQKITIDVAYRYFSYQGSKFIIADAPGHEQYTRNMAVAAANSDTIIILIDATKGVKTQTIRHSYIAHLFGIKNVIVAINKMDLVHYDYEIFDNIKKTYLEKTISLAFENVYFVPIAAVLGENIVQKSNLISWYQGKTIVEYLLNSEKKIANQNLVRLQIQNIIKHENQRYYQGFLASGEIKIGDEIMIYQAQRNAKITKIIHSENEVKKAEAENSISITLDREVDLERGGLITNNDNRPYFDDHFSAYLIWFSPEEFSLKNNREFNIKINHNHLRAKINNINHIIDVNNLSNVTDVKEYQHQEISLNQIANVNLNLSVKTAFDIFQINRNTGSFFLTDKNSNETVACGIISNFLAIEDKAKNREEHFLSELQELLRKHFGHRNIDFTI